MRIIGGRDYYDNAMMYGQDTSIVFIRPKDSFVELESIKNYYNLFKFSSQDFSEIKGRKVTLDLFEAIPIDIYLCGIRYTGIKLTTQDRYSYKQEFHYFYTKEKFEAFIEDLGYEEKKYRWRVGSIKNSTDYFNQSGSKNLQDYMIENRITIMTLNRIRRQYDNIFNFRIDGDDLKDFQFFKKMNSFDCYQEIAMWIGGVLPQNPNATVDITDNVIKLHKHGFDKYSFKKMKENK
jgi:hypothetical protein